MSFKIFTLNSIGKSPAYIFLFLGLLFANLNLQGNNLSASFDNPPPTEDTCIYTLELFDSFGDGWNGSVLTITVNGVSTDYTLNFGESEGVFTVEVPTNAEFIATYLAGGFQNEVTYNILDGTGTVIFSDGPFPQTGVVLDIVGCPSCPAPYNLSVDNVGGIDADISWTPADSSGVFLLEYDTTGFALGTGNTMTTSNSSITANWFVRKYSV